jgi:hypothetical protein
LGVTLLEGFYQVGVGEGGLGIFVGDLKKYWGDIGRDGYICNILDPCAFGVVGNLGEIDFYCQVILVFVKYGGNHWFIFKI